MATEALGIVPNVQVSLNGKLYDEKETDKIYDVSDLILIVSGGQQPINIEDYQLYENVPASAFINYQNNIYGVETESDLPEKIIASAQLPIVSKQFNAIDIFGNYHNNIDGNGQVIITRNDTKRRN